MLEGNIVTLKPEHKNLNCIKMTVEKVESNGDTKCWWLSTQGILQTATFKQILLVKLWD